MSDSLAAWLIRAGSHGEREDFVLKNGIAGVGFEPVSDLTTATDRDQVRTVVRNAYPDAKERMVANFAGQLWSLRSRVKPGDLVALPLKRSSQIALGLVTRGYEYLADERSAYRHRVSVDWKRTDVPRTAIGQDLLYSLGAAMTVCQIQRNDALWRLQRVLKTGTDPGARVEVIVAAENDGVEAADSSEPVGDIERLGRDQIHAHVAAQFAGHRLADLVAAVLRAEGFVTRVALPGRDGGIDIFAGSGPLGLDSPKLIVQVKSSPTPVDVKIVRELHGVLATHGADQALLVAWGGVNKPARDELRSEFFRVRDWDADDLLDAILRNYERLDEEWRAELPLKRIWSLASEPVE